MNTVNFGEFISVLRKEKGLTQKQLADLLSLTDKAVSRWETGKNYPDIEMLEKISEVLDVTVSELLESKRMPKEEIVEATEKNIVKQLKINKKGKRKFVVLSSLFVVLILISGYITLSANGYFDGVIYKNIDIYSNDVLTILNNAEGYITSRKNAEGNFIVNNFNIFINSDKTTNNIYFEGTTENGRSFYVNSLANQEPPNKDYCFIGEFRKNQAAMKGIPISELKKIISILDFSVINKNNAKAKRYLLDSRSGLTDSKGFSVADNNSGKVWYIYDNGSIRLMNKNDIISGNYLVINLWLLNETGDNAITTTDDSVIIYYQI